ncbi:MAG: apolipoprotein N-acyltransferase [Akkermansiaceae bacterium]|nr:apolipoprotein N-acyltransferase [Akkermansiaceae bacterium]
MNSTTKRILNRLRNVLISFVSGVLMSLAFPPYDLGNWVWIGLIPLLCVLWLGKRGFLRGFGHAWLYGAGWYGSCFWWVNEVGNTFSIPPVLFFAVAFIPLVSLFACLPGLWGGIANTLLRPRMEAKPDTSINMPQEQRKELWSSWAHRDLFSTLRCAVGCGALWVCIEWVRGNGDYSCGWNSMGMALYNGLSMVQWAEFVGTMALSFIPVFTAVVLWGAVRRSWLHFRGIGKGCIPWDFYGTAIILFGLFLGGLFLSKSYSPNVMMRRDTTMQLPVMGVQLNLDQSERMAGGGMHPEYYGMLLRNTALAFNEIQRDTVTRAMKNSDIGIIQQLPVWVVWPESAMGTPLHRDVVGGQLLRDPYTKHYFLHENGLPAVRSMVREMGGADFVVFTGADELLWGARDGEPLPQGLHNSMAVISGDFSGITTHAKQHLMPFGEYVPLAREVDWIGKAYEAITGIATGEGIKPGNSTQPLTVPVPGTDEQVGVIPAICYEDTVGALLRKYVRKGPQVIVNVTNDGWFRDSHCGVQQARSAAFRCIELRRPMVRAANKGLTCAIAPNGAVIDSLQKADGSPHLAGFCYAVLPVDRNAGFTLYAMLGDWAVIVCALLASGLSLGGLRRKS